MFSTFEMEGMLSSLYRITLMKLVYDHVGSITFEEALNYNPYFDSADSFSLLFEKLINQIVDISYFFEGHQEVDEELQQTPFYDEIRGYDWSTLYFIPNESILKTEFFIRKLEYVFHRYFTGTTLCGTVKGYGIYIGMVGVDLGNYFEQLQYIIEVIKESEGIM